MRDVLKLSVVAGKLCCLIGFLSTILPASAAACLPDSHRHLTRTCNIESKYSQLFNIVFGQLAKPRQIAVISGVSKYPLLPTGLQLPPAEYDVETFADILANKLTFDEVIVLKNADFTHENLKFVFENYLPDTLKSNPKSRVVFSFSGHGADFDETGFLFFSNTRTIAAGSYTELTGAISLREVRTILAPTMRYAQHFLALVNACNGGYFLDVGASFGASALEERGAHGITAGGAQDVVHARANVGSGKGSVFFEMIFAALTGRDVVVGGRSFASPSREDGILTTTRLADYLINTVQIIENFRLSPRMGSLTGRGPGNQGEFFFLTNYELAKAALSRRFPKDAERVFGAEAKASVNIDEARTPGLYARHTIPLGAVLDSEMFAAIEARGNQEVQDRVPTNFARHVKGSCLAVMLHENDRLTWDHLRGNC